VYPPPPPPPAEAAAGQELSPTPSSTASSSIDRLPPRRLGAAYGSVIATCGSKGGGCRGGDQERWRRRSKWAGGRGRGDSEGDLLVTERRRVRIYRGRGWYGLALAS
jgi:hypothetical protein